jgi:hypothetical protein
MIAYNGGNSINQGEAQMADVKIRIFRGEESEPETTVTIPGTVLDVASKLIPRRATAALQEHGIELEELVELSKREDVRGTLIEVQQHKKGERIVVALE